MSITLEALRLGARQRADQLGFEDRFPDAEVDGYINAGIAEVYDMLVSAQGYAYYGVQETYPVAADTESFALPVDFYKAYKVEYINGSTRYELDRVSETDVSDLSNIEAGRPLYFRVRASQLDVFPAVSTGSTILLSYVPSATQLVNPSDTFDGINGWEEYVMVFAAKKMSLKDADFELVNYHLGELNRLEERIKRMAADRTSGKPQRIQDVRGATAARRMGWWNRWNR